MLFTLLRSLISVLQSQRALAVENLALRHQLNVLQRTAKKPRLRGTDRLLSLLSIIPQGFSPIIPHPVIRENPIRTRMLRDQSKETVSKAPSDVSAEVSGACREGRVEGG